MILGERAQKYAQGAFIRKSVDPGNDLKKRLEPFKQYIKRKSKSGSVNESKNSFNNRFLVTKKMSGQYRETVDKVE